MVSHLRGKERFTMLSNILDSIFEVTVFSMTFWVSENEICVRRLMLSVGLYFNCIIIVWFQVHYCCVQRQNYKLPHWLNTYGSKCIWMFFFFLFFKLLNNKEKIVNMFSWLNDDWAYILKGSLFVFLSCSLAG